MDAPGTDDDAELFELDQLIRAYLHQDMELDAPTVPQAVARYARLNDAGTARRLEAAMDHFVARFGNQLAVAFERRYGHDHWPGDRDEDVLGFFAMVRTLLSDPEAFRQFEAG